jgi:hypothetical protein
VSEFVESVARAMRESLRADPRFAGMATWEQFDGKAQYLHQARAAIEAVRDGLTDDMIDAGCECDAYAHVASLNQARHDARVADGKAEPKKRGAAPIEVLPIIWRAMLDKALA